MEGLLACVYVCVLALAALAWVLWMPAPDRSQLSRPVPVLSEEEARALAIKAWNERVVAETLRSFDPTISPEPSGRHPPCPATDATSEHSADSRSQRTEDSHE